MLEADSHRNYRFVNYHEFTVNTLNIIHTIHHYKPEHYRLFTNLMTFINVVNYEHQRNYFGHQLKYLGLRFQTVLP